jgi:hypothetical protein
MAWKSVVSLTDSSESITPWYRYSSFFYGTTTGVQRCRCGPSEKIAFAHPGLYAHHFLNPSSLLGFEAQTSNKEVWTGFWWAWRQSWAIHQTWALLQFALYVKIVSFFFASTPHNLPKRLTPTTYQDTFYGMSALEGDSLFNKAWQTTTKEPSFAVCATL